MRALLMWKKKWVFPVWAWIYHAPSLWLISLSSNGNDWITVADKNLWATQVWHPWDALSQNNCWNFFQWGNNYWFPRTWGFATSNVQVDTTWYWPWNYYNSWIFILTNTDWSSINNGNLRWDVTNTLVARQWPCPAWFHVLSRQDQIDIYQLFANFGFSWQNVLDYLLLPPAWYLNRQTWQKYWDWQSAFLQSSHAIWWVSQFLTIDNVAYQHSQFERWQALSIRPFANTPVVPDSTWTVLYQP